MPPERRRATPQGSSTRHVLSKANRDLSRRLRQTLIEVDWLDVLLGAILGQLLDALGGSAIAQVIECGTMELLKRIGA